MNEKQLSFNHLWEDCGHQPQKSVAKEIAGVMGSKGAFHMANDLAFLIAYVDENLIALTKKHEFIPSKSLIEINEQLSIQTENATIHSKQEYYPYIHLLYHLAIAGGLFEKVDGTGGKRQLHTTERAALFLTLKDTEKHYFLLETFWVDVNWSSLLGRNTDILAIQLTEIFIAITSYTQPQLGYEGHQMLLYLEWFGLWTCKKDEEKIKRDGRKNAFYVDELTVTDFGRKVITIMLYKRNPQWWNITHRRLFGELNPIPGTPFDIADAFGLKGDNRKTFDHYAKLDQSDESFIEPFKALYPHGELHNTLPRRIVKFVHGLHTFKVSWKKDVWRMVVLSAENTMDSLHKMIIKSYEFDDDHLYSFFMDGKKWSKHCIVSPYDDTGDPQATEIQIGAVGFTVNQCFLYLFDYGNEWLFTVEVSDIESRIQDLDMPYVESGSGAAPRQYSDYDDW